eukprot:TRINITY_DN1539_c0_g1_i1.p1 TRINITY_DN1539_c0_g1~~TRINITY_DN1539_c0_g1_i1.p1  ORF type:complete len:416 (+),score=116.55 TRINITY_DN1539_c0_g1_i1:73-1320(+)
MMRRFSLLSVALILGAVALCASSVQSADPTNYDPIKVADRVSHVMNPDEFADDDEWDLSDDLVDTGAKSKNTKVAQDSHVDVAEDESQDPNVTEKVETVKAPVDYTYEYIGIFCAVLYGINYLIGKSQNDKIAAAWVDKFSQQFKDQFALVEPVDKESGSTYTIYATGRNRVNYVFATLELKKRFDLFSVIKDILTPVQDKLHLHVTFASDSVGPFVFCAVTARDKKEYIRQNDDLKRFARLERNHPTLEKIAIKSEHEDIISQFLDSTTNAALTSSFDLFESIHVTDHAFLKIGETTHIKKQARFVFKLPDASKMDRLKPLMDVAFNYLDLIPNILLSTHSRTKAADARKLYQDEQNRANHAKRQENAQRLKLERKKKEEEEIAKKSPEEQRKWEEKEHKKELKKKMKQRVLVM